MVTATYTLDATKPTDVQLFYSADKAEPRTWLPATTFPAQLGTNTHYWNCDAAGATYGQFFFKLEVVEESSCCQPTTIDLAMIAVEGGEFTMGDTRGSGYSSELPTHQVTLSNFCISETPITQAQFEEVLKYNPSNFQGGVYAPSDDKPVETVNWYHAIAFCNKLSWDEGKTLVYSVKVGGVEIDWTTIVYDDVPLVGNSDWNAATMNMSANGYRLPTEAEWEYAARGGQENLVDYLYSGSDNIGDVAWYSGNNGSSGTPTYGTKLVKQKLPNALGLYDMSGNVYEWCWDWFSSYTATPKIDPTGATSGSYRVDRGGSWNYDADFARVSFRIYNYPYFRDSKLGFRIACSSE